jgi:hypothetical protein
MHLDQLQLRWEPVYSTNTWNNSRVLFSHILDSRREYLYRYKVRNMNAFVFIKQLCHVIELIYAAFGLLIRYPEHLHNICTNINDILTELHTPKMTANTAHVKSSIFTSRCLVAALNRGRSPPLDSRTLPCLSYSSSWLIHWVKPSYIWPKVSRPVCLDVRHPSRIPQQFFSFLL